MVNAHFYLSVSILVTVLLSGALYINHLAYSNIKQIFSGMLIILL